MSASAGTRGRNMTMAAGRDLEAGGEEALADRLRRWILGTVWALKPPRTLGVPATLAMLAAHYAGLDSCAKGELPDPDHALAHPDGLAGICEDMSVDTLMRAYGRGLYPFCHIGPMKWWAPKERMVLFPGEFHIEKNLRRKLRQRPYRITFDRDFEGVMRGCAGARPGRWHLTWITPPMIRAFKALFDAGHAHSVEAWDKETGELVGGAYGVAEGRVFFTESQFARARDASKIGFAVLNCHLQQWGFVLNDGKHRTGHLAGLGFRPLPRAEFNAILSRHCMLPGRTGRWTVDPSLDVGQWDPAAPMTKPAA